MVVKRGDVFLVALDPTVGHEITKTRPALVVSPDEMNRNLGTVIVAPLSTKGKPFPTRVPCRLNRRDGSIVLDQLRTVDRVRLIRRVGRLPDEILKTALELLVEMFTWGTPNTETQIAGTATTRRSSSGRQ